jgi:hypothetical protein
MYCNCGNEARLAEIGYIEPITTGAPLRLAVLDDEPGVVPDVDDADVLEPLLEQAAVASATQARPTAKRGHFLVATIIHLPSKDAGHRHACSVLFQDTHI